MKVLAAYSHKGGSGKTTALLMLAQAIMARGKNVLLVDCDPQVNFRRWKEESDPAHWPIGSEVIYCNYELTLPQVMTDVLVEANESGRFDYALLNLPGVDHPFNAFVLKYAELTLIPFKPGATELVELAPAVAAIRRLSEQDQIGEVRIVFAQTNDMTAADRLYAAAARESYPYLGYEIPKSAVFKNIAMEGVFHRMIAQYGDVVTGLDKVKINNLRKALAECEQFLAACDDIMESVDA